MNKQILVGRLGSDPELKFLPNDTAVAKITVATSESYKDKSGEWKNITDWHNVIFWRQSAENANKILKKGDLVEIVGKSKTRKYRKDGEDSDRYVTEVHVDQWSKTPEKKDKAGIDKPVNTTAELTTTTTAKGSAGPGDPGDDLPF